MNNPENNNTPSFLEDGKRIRQELKSSESWVHTEEISSQDKKEQLIKDIEAEHERVRAFFKRIKEIQGEIKTSTDKGEVAVKERLLNVMDYQKFVAVKKRYELAQGLSREEKLELENKLGDVDLFNEPN